MALAPMKTRTATPDDAAVIAAICVPIVRHTTISFELEPPTVGWWQPPLRALDEPQAPRAFGGGSLRE